MLNFHEIFGHDQIKDYFQKAIRANKVSHAYILDGETGMGRKSLAHAFALSLLCEKGKNQPCMECHACKQVISNSHPDLIHVTHEKSASIGVDDIREQINDTVLVRPYSSYYKIYIVDEAEKMTIQAQNALLKTIEEPPSYAVIILLTTKQEALLPTILSRCVLLKLKPLKDFIVRGYLVKNLLVPEADADVYAAFARGNLGKAISIASSEKFRLMHQAMLHLMRHIHDVGLSELLDYIGKLKENDLDIQECLDFMQIWYRDVLLYKVTRDINLLIFKDEFKTINEISTHSAYSGLETVVEAIDKAKVRLHANVNMELTMELLLLVMKEN